ncbi:hypothetical protein [Butyricimonas virosa]|uniref:hypothetical protein n=1 Tax=Butyricimonas virosa TaxID=544645 RepID=UPI00242E6861|nr:hypothetical protein [Butyricimonas virosa]
MMKWLNIFMPLLAIGWLVSCENECLDCDENSHAIALYINAKGSAKDSIINITGNVYNLDMGTRSIFSTEKIDSVYYTRVDVFENIERCRIELDISLRGDKKSITVDIPKLDFTDSKISLLSLTILVGVLGLEVIIPEYLPDQETELN